MRNGKDGSRDTLLIRKLIQEDQLNCHWCGIPESRKHIIEECELYNQPRNKLRRQINSEQF